MKRLLAGVLAAFLLHTAEAHAQFACNEVPANAGRQLQARTVEVTVHETVTWAKYMDPYPAWPARIYQRFMVPWGFWQKVSFYPKGRLHIGDRKPWATNHGPHFPVWVCEYDAYIYPATKRVWKTL